MKKKNQGVYRWVNLVNGKSYVGSTTNFEDRKKNHISGLNRGVHSFHFQRAWNKYGKDNFLFEVIEEVSDIFWLRARESAWIHRLDSANPAHGYNLMTDGWTSLASFSDESRARMSASQKARYKRGEGPKPTREQLAPQRAKMKLLWADPIWRAFILEKRKGQYTPEARAEKSKVTKEWWTPEKRAIQSIRMKKVMTKELGRKMGRKGLIAQGKTVKEETI
jgi:group I intron endonuclease